MKFYKVYFYTLRPIMLLLLISFLRYLLGDRNVFLMERVIICLLGGLILGAVWYLMDWYKTRKNIMDWISRKLESKGQNKSL